MTIKEINEKIQAAKDTLQAAKYKFPSITNMEIEIKGIPIETLKEYSEKNALNIKFTEHGWNFINLDQLRENNCDSRIVLISKFKYES